MPSLCLNASSNTTTVEAVGLVDFKKRGGEVSQLKITNAGIAYKDAIFAGLETTNITHMFFANVPGINENTPIDPNALIPHQHVVHTQKIERVSAVEQDAVVISAVLDYQIGNFDFNWFGAVATRANGTRVLVAIVHTKKANKKPAPTGQTLATTWLNQSCGAPKALPTA